LHLSPAAARDIVGAIRRATDDAVSDKKHAQRALVIVTRPDIRRFVRQLVETELPEIPVVASSELLPEITLRARGRASLVGL
jgi:type III secretion protein V